LNHETCLKEHLRATDKDPFKIKSIIKIVDIRLNSIAQIKKDEESASIITEGYYEAIKELLTAFLLKQGLRSDNHECLISFFKNEFPDYEYEANIIYELKDVRNGINYDGILISKEYLDRNELEFKHLIEILKGLINT
jgi:uncharacterized protein (UPF0332 family)